MALITVLNKGIQLLLFDIYKKRKPIKVVTTNTGKTINSISSSFPYCHNFLAKHEVKRIIMLFAVNVNTLLWTIVVV